MQVNNLQVQYSCHFWVSTKYMNRKDCNLISSYSQYLFYTFILEGIICLSSSDNKPKCQWCLSLIPLFDSVWRSVLSVHHLHEKVLCSWESGIPRIKINICTFYNIVNTKTYRPKKRCCKWLKIKIQFFATKKLE